MESESQRMLREQREWQKNKRTQKAGEGKNTSLVATQSIQSISPPLTNGSNLDVLKGRLARGEIGLEEFERLKIILTEEVESTTSLVRETEVRIQHVSGAMALHQPTGEGAAERVVPLSGGEVVPVPFATQAPPPLVPVSATVPAQHSAPDPHDLLGQLDRKARQAIPDDRKRKFAYIAGGVLVWQVVMPSEITPMGIIGYMTGDMRGGSSSMAARAQQVAQLETQLADVKGRYEEAKGNCMYAGILGMNSQCKSLVAQRFDPQISGLESQIEELRPKSFGEKIKELLF